MGEAPSPARGIASILASVGLLLFYVLQQIPQKDMPTVSGLETLVRAAKTARSPAAVAADRFFDYLDSKTLLCC